MKIVDFEFDKEMDTLLRQTARGEAAFAAENSKFKTQNSKLEHLDADEISAFAENALPVKMRVRATEHLADCARCRKILSSLISLDAEAQSETIHAGGGSTVVAAPALPWHKRLFAFPQMSYAVGALALVFAAIVGFVVLQSRETAQNSSVARIEETAERPLNGKGASSDGETVSSETYSSNASSLNMATTNSNMATGNTATTANDPPARLANSNASAAQPQKTPEAERDAKSAPPVSKPVSAPAAPQTTDAVQAPPASENRFQTDADAPREAERSRSETQNNSALNQQNITPDSRSVQHRSIQNLPLAGRSTREMQTQDSAAAPKRKAEARSDQAAETRVAGGKTFRRADGVWYDANYRNQPTTNVRRGTDEYKKLDSRLRSIGDSLSGVVVVVFNGKAYRIQ